MAENLINLTPDDITNIAINLYEKHGEYQGGVAWRTLVVRVVDAIDDYRNTFPEYQLRVHPDGSAVRRRGGEWHWVYPSGEAPPVVPPIPDVQSWTVAYEGDD